MLNISKEYKYCLRNKIHRTIKRMVGSSSLVDLKKNSSTKNTYQLVKSLKDLTVNSTEELKSKSKTRSIQVTIRNDKTSTSASRRKSEDHGKSHRRDDTKSVEAGMNRLSLSPSRGNMKGKHPNDSSCNPRDSAKRGSAEGSL